MKRVFLDANVLWSAARQPEGRPWRLIGAGRAEFVTSHYALAEARRNLSPESLPDLAALARKIELVADAFGPPPAGVQLPAKDLPIFATAAMAGADLLCTGDRDFEQYFGRTVGGVKVILPRDLTDELKGKSEGGPGPSPPTRAIWKNFPQRGPACPRPTEPATAASFNPGMQITRREAESRARINPGLPPLHSALSTFLFLLACVLISSASPIAVSQRQVAPSYRPAARPCAPRVWPTLHRGRSNDQSSPQSQ